MAQQEHELVISRPLAEVFAFFLQPANMVRVYPPEYHLELIEAPPRLQLGSILSLTSRRWGIRQRLVSEVTGFEANVYFTDELRKGPFPRWVHTHRFTPDSGGTQVHDRIDFEPPGGLLGLLVTADTIRKDLERAFAYRDKKIGELFALDR